MDVVAQQDVVNPVVVPACVTPKLSKLLSDARYSAPSVVSFSLKGVLKVGQTSMIGNM